MFRHRFWPLKILFFVILGALGIFAIGAAVFQLWNHLVPDLFHGPSITMLQAYLLLGLSWLLFGGLSGGRMGRGGRCGGKGRGGWGHHGHWREWWEAEGKQSFENFQKNKSKE